MTALADLFSGDDERAQQALERLTPEDGPVLRAALWDREPDRRIWSAAALARLPDDESLRALLTAAADPDSDVRAAVLHALGQRRAPEAVTPLLFALSTSSPHFARLVGDALIQVGQPAVPALIAALEREVVPLVRIQLVRALALIGDTRAIPALFHALDDESAIVLHWAEEGLERMGVGQVYFRP